MTRRPNDPRPTAPASLREAVARDLRPTRPLKPPAVRALALLPLAVAIVVAIPALHFFRPDMRVIGFLRAWGFSAGQALAGLVIVAAALRESIPGRGLSRASLTWTLAGGLLIPIVLLLLTARTFDIGPAPATAWSKARSASGFRRSRRCRRCSSRRFSPRARTRCVRSSREHCMDWAVD